MYRKGCTCLGRTPLASNGFILSVLLSLFSTIWGICSSLTASPNVVNSMCFGTVLLQFTSD
jgi:hypothetical protein